MKPFILPALCCVLLLSCKKENTAPEPVENSNQQLTRITSTGEFGGGSYAVEYQFNSAGKIVKEGNKTYERDDQQRIVRIHHSDMTVDGILMKGYDVMVHYNDKHSGEVAYTIIKEQEINATDSVAYFHDNGKLTKLMLYDLYPATQNTPDTTYYLGYFIFKYDTIGNLLLWDNYAIDYNGKLIHCSQLNFGKYDNRINPLYSGDEVRDFDFSCENMLNNSKNNFTNGSGYIKTYEYRADGRPRSCLIRQNGRMAGKLIFEYK